MTTFGLLRRTYLFVILRFLVICLTVIPIVSVVRFYIGFLIDFFGLTETSGMVRNVFAGCFGYIGFLVGWFLFDILRKTVLFYVKAAHVIAITKLCVDDAPVHVVRDKEGEIVEEKILVGALLGESVKEVFKRFISVNIFYAADGLVKKGLSDVSNLLLTQNVLPILKSKGFMSKFLGGTIKTTVSFSDEIVMSYVFFRCRLNDVFGDDSKHKKESVKELMGFAVEGMCLYVKSCLGLMKSAFITVLMSEIFGFIVVLLSVIVLFNMFHIEFFYIVVVFIAMRVIYAVLSYTFLEPYQTVALVSQFYGIVSDEEEDMDTEGMKSKLSNLSKPFKSLVNKALGKEDEDMSEASGSGTVFDENLLDLAKKGLSDTANEMDKDGDS